MPKPCVFISYSRTDARQAEQLEAVLSRQFDVWRDKRRIESDWSRDIGEALATKAHVVCLLWSRPAAASTWVKHEWVTARALQRWVVPYVLDGAPDLPMALRSLDFIQAPDVGGLRLRIERLIEKAEPAHFDFNVLPPNVFLPFRPNPSFRGRAHDLIDLYLRMIGNLNKTGCNQTGLVGLGGSGKTQLASEFAYRFGFSFEGIYWLDATDETAWMASFIALAKRLLDAEQFRPDDPIGCVQSLQAYWRAHPGTLLIMDNVRDPLRLNSDEPMGIGIAPLAIAGNLLFTTRQRFSLSGVGEQLVDVLTPEAAYQLLTDGNPAAGADEMQAARDICDAVGRLPLALVLIAGSFRTAKRSYTAYRELLQRRGLQAIDLNDLEPEELATRHRVAVHETLAEQYGALTDPVSRDLFRMSGLLPESAVVHDSLVGLLIGLEPTDDAVDPLASAFARLRRATLIQEVADASAHRLHPLVHEFAEELTPEAQRDRVRQDAGARLTSALLRPECLARQHRVCGTDEIIEELALAAQWNPADRRAAFLKQAVEREHPNLLTDGFVQQIHYRARAMDLDDVAQRFGDALVRSGEPGFRCISIGELDDAAFARSYALYWPTCMAVTPDCQRVAIGSREHFAVWEVGAGLRRSLTTDIREPFACWFSESTPTALTGATKDGWRAAAIEQWELGAARPSRVLRRRGQWLRSLLRKWCAAESAWCSPGGRYALVQYHDSIFTLWDVRSGKQLHEQKGRARAAFSADELGAAVAVDGQTLWWWSFVPELRLRRLENPLRALSGIALTPDGTSILGTAGDELLHWDVRSGRIVQRAAVDGASLVDVCVSPDGERALTSAEDFGLTLWERTSTRLTVLATLRGHSNRITAMSFVGRSRAISGSVDRRLVDWDLDEAERRQATRDRPRRLSGVWCSTDGKLVIGSSAYRLTVLDSTSGRPLRTLDSGREAITMGAVDAQGRMLAASWRDPALSLWDIHSGKSIAQWSNRDFAPHPDSDEDPRDARNVRSLCLSTDGRFAVTGSWAGHLCLWDIDQIAQKREPLAYFPDRRGLLTRTGLPQGHQSVVDACCFNGDNSLLLSASFETVILWDVATRSELQRFTTGQRLSVVAVGFSSNDRHVLGVDLMGTIFRWDIETAAPVGQPRKEHSVPLGVCFDANGDTVLVGFERRIVWIDLARGEEVARLSIKGATKGIDWRGSTVAVASDPGGIQIFELTAAHRSTRRDAGIHATRGAS